MIDIKYANAFSEVLDILFNLSEAEYNRIPKKFIKFLDNNCNPEYEFYYNPNKTLDEQEVSFEAKTIIAIICRDFLATKEERTKIIKKEKNELIEYEKKQREKYNPNDIFKKIEKNVLLLPTLLVSIIVRNIFMIKKS